jgi:ATP-dependent DNA ligase
VAHNGVEPAAEKLLLLSVAGTHFDSLIGIKARPGPCLPTKTDKLRSGSQWLHEIKHDGFRIIARKNGSRARLYSRSGREADSARVR